MTVTIRMYVLFLEISDDLKPLKPLSNMRTFVLAQLLDHRNAEREAAIVHSMRTPNKKGNHDRNQCPFGCSRLASILSFLGVPVSERILANPLEC
jgi:hypothetical protein